MLRNLKKREYKMNYLKSGLSKIETYFLNYVNKLSYVQRKPETNLGIAEVNQLDSLDVPCQTSIQS